jgi:hypothetical protein
LAKPRAISRSLVGGNVRCAARRATAFGAFRRRLVLAEASEQRGDVGHDRNGKPNPEHLLMSLTAHKQPEQTTHGEDCVEAEIDPIRKLAAHNDILDHADHKRGQKKAEESAMLAIEKGLEVHSEFVDLLGQRHGGHQVQRGRLCENEAEVEKAPLASESETVHGPPDLHVDKKENCGPKE